MSGIQLTGLASGLDWRSLVDKLIAAETVPQNRLRSEKSAGTQKTNVLESLKTSLTSLQSAIQPLGTSSDAFAARKATLASASTSWATSATAGTETGTYQIQVTQLATKAQRTGSADSGKALNSSADVSGLTLSTIPITTAITAGEFTVNGARITVALTDSLQDIFNQISTKTGGTVTASYDPASDKTRLSSSTEIVLGSANDTSNFLRSLQLYNNGTGEVLGPKALGVVSVSAAIANANLREAITSTDISGNGSFSVNGTTIAYNVNSDSVQNVLSRINASAAGVTANYDKVNDRFTLTNKTTGDVGISISESPGGLLGALGLGNSASFVRGKDAQFNIDGGPTLTSASNTLDDSSHGITGLSIAVTSETTDSVTVGGDNAGARTKIEDFIAKFNAVQTFIDQQTKSSTTPDGKVTANILAGNREVSDIAKQLRNKIFAAVPGLSGSIQRLESIGIDFKSSSSILEVKDSGKLDAALRDHGSDVRTLFSDTTNGLSKRLDSFITQITGTTGTLTTQTASIAKQSKSIDEQISAMDRRLAQQKTLLEQGFIRMESAQSNIQSQLSALNNAF
ncbi:MAG: flagellar filament capping protein FliD, partial [Verrucomicrobiota bacterium]